MMLSNIIKTEGSIEMEQGDTIDVSPSADYPIGETDILVVLGDSAALEKVQKL